MINNTASQPAIGDACHRVYAAWSGLTQEDRVKLAPTLRAETLQAYAEGGPNLAAVMLRRGWALDAERSWAYLLTLDQERTNLLVLRELWALASVTHFHVLIGERILLHLGATSQSLTQARLAGAWREFRARVASWLGCYLPSLRRPKELAGGASVVFWVDAVGVTHEWDEARLIQHLLAMWPLPDPPADLHVEDTVERVRAWIAGAKLDPTLAWTLRDPLSRRATMYQKNLQDWEAQHGLRSVKLEPARDGRGRPKSKVAETS